jgi:hypothetical protein
MGFFSAILRPVLYTMEDFMEQSLVMKACIGWGWLSVIIMIASLVPTLPAVFGAATG